MVQIRRQKPKRNEHVGMQKGANSTTVSVGLIIKVYKIFARQYVYQSLSFLSNLLLTKSRLSLSKTEIFCVEHVKL